MVTCPHTIYIYVHVDSGSKYMLTLTPPPHPKTKITKALEGPTKVAFHLQDFNNGKCPHPLLEVILRAIYYYIINMVVS